MMRLVRREAGNKPATAASQNTLKIMYPATSDFMPVEVPVTAWVRYTDATGKGLPSQPITPSIISGSATVPQGSVTTDGSGWASFDITFSQPGTLGTKASYKATLKVTANNNQSDTDQAELTASTSAGGPSIITFSDTVDIGEPSDAIVGGKWTLISGRYLNADGSPAAFRQMYWDAESESGSKLPVPNPMLGSGLIYSDEDGQFRNFILTPFGPSVNAVTVSFEAQNFYMPNQADVAKKTYPNKPGTDPIAYIDLSYPTQFAPRQGVTVNMQATYRRDNGPVEGRTVQWQAAPSTVTWGDGGTTTSTTDGRGQSAKEITPPLKNGRYYSEAIWADIVENGVLTRGAIVRSPYGPSDCQAETLQIGSPDGSVLIPGKPHTIVATLTDYQGNPLPGRSIYWWADLPELFIFSQPYPSTTDQNGEASIQVTAISQEPHDLTLIGAKTANLLSGERIDGNFWCSIAGGTVSLTVKSAEPIPLELYKPHELIATYAADDNKNKSVEWTVEPEGEFTLAPNPSTTSGDGQGVATTYITGFGPNNPVSGVTVFASTWSDTLGRYVLGATQPPLSFKPGTPPDPHAARIDLVSVAGDPVTAGDVHLIQATYTNLDGAPIVGHFIQWQAFPRKKITLLEDLTYTNDDGVATTGVIGDLTSAPFEGTIQASTANPFTNGTDASSLLLTFQQQANVPGSIPMQLRSNDPSPLSSGDPHEFTVSYVENKDIHWAAFPSDRITFLGPNPSTTNDQGISTMRLEADGEIANAIIAAWSSNPLTGTHDHAAVTVDFKATAEGGITITTQDGGSTWWYYEPYTLTATYDGTDPGVTEVVWSTGPEQGTSGHTFTFDRNPTLLVDGKATTAITAFGPNLAASASVTVYARSTDPIHFATPGQKSLAFGPSQSVPTIKLIDVVSLDGDPLASGQVHVIQATYIQANGKPVPIAPLTWAADPSASVTLSAGHGPTDANGVMTNVVQSTRTDPFDFTVTVSADGTSDTSELKLTFQPGADLPGSGTMTLTSQDEEPLTVGDAHELSVTYLGADGKPMPNGTEVTWAAFPSDRLSFVDGDKTKTSGDNGVATNHVKASQGDSIPNAVISTTAFNPNTAANDHGNLPLDFKASVQQPDEIVVLSPDTAPLYAPLTLTAQHTGTQETVTEVVWSVDPGEDTTHTFTFDPPRSPLTGNGGTTGTTQIKGVGPNADVAVTVYAHPNPPDPNVQLVPKTITFEQQPTVPAGASVNVVSEDGDPLRDGVYHLFQATYLNNDGTKATTQGWDGTITWGPLDDPNHTWLITKTTPTNEHGVATNALMGKSAGDVTVTVQATGTPDKAPPLTITFVDHVTQQPGQGSMTITAPPGTLTIGQSYPFSVHYLDSNHNPVPEGTEVTWTGLPADRLTFSDGRVPGNTSKTTNGFATIEVTASEGDDIPTAVIATTGLVNPKTGSPDHSDPDITVSFKAVSLLTGIMINRPWAQNPDFSDVNPRTPCQVVTGKISLAKSEGDGQISLATEPGALPVRLFKTDYTPITLDDSGRYPITTQNGSAEFLVGAKSPSIFALQAYYPPTEAAPLCSADLTLSTIGGLYGGTQWPLVIENLDCTTNPCVLTMPPQSQFPDPTFKVSIPQNASLDDSANVQIVLNYRVAYSGTVRAIREPNYTSIAYAMLQPKGNWVGYLVGSGKSITQFGDLSFDAQGTAQTYPTTGTASPIFPAPAIVRNNPLSQTTVQATDIVNGLSGLIRPTSTQPGWAFQDGDKITLYYYLSGAYPLPSYKGCPVVPPRVTNVCYLTYTVRQGDELTSGQAKILDPLPQKFLAGYGAPGTIQLNFKVERGNQTFWSKGSATMLLDTASLDPTT